MIYLKRLNSIIVYFRIKLRASVFILSRLVVKLNYALNMKMKNMKKNWQYDLFEYIITMLQRHASAEKSKFAF